MLFSSLCIFWKKISLILCLNESIFFVDFKSDDRLFHIFGPKYDRHFWPVLLLRIENAIISANNDDIENALSGVTANDLKFPSIY